MDLKSRNLKGKALMYIGSKGQEEAFLNFIGPGAQFLRTKFDTVGGPGRGAQLAFFICSGKDTWVLKKDDWLVVFEDGSMKVMTSEEISFFFEEG